MYNGKYLEGGYAVKKKTKSSLSFFFSHSLSNSNVSANQERSSFLIRWTF